jgi:hypothetical protein
MNAIDRLRRVAEELAKAWAVAVKDIRVYYLRPGSCSSPFQ